MHKKSPYSEFSGPYFPTFGLDMETYRVPLQIQSKCRKIQIRKAPITDTFHTVVTTFMAPTALIVLQHSATNKNYFICESTINQ